MLILTYSKNHHGVEKKPNILCVFFCLFLFHFFCNSPMSQILFNFIILKYICCNRVNFFQKLKAKFVNRVKFLHVNFLHANFIAN